MTTRRAALFPLLIAALVIFTSAVYADPPVTPAPPAGYVYGEETVNTSLSQTIGSNIVSDGTFDNGWWTLESGWSIADGVATHTSGSTSAFYQSSSLVADDFYEVQFEVVSSSGTGGVLMALGITGSETSYFGNVGTYQTLLRYPATSPAVPLIIVGANYNFHGSVDNVFVRSINRQPVSTASADGTHTLSFSLPSSPLAGQRIELRYRVVDALNYLAVRLQRNSANNAWDLSLIRVVSGAETSIISQSNVGSVDAIRVMSVSSNHYIYTGSSGSYTQWWSISESTHATATGLTSIYNGAFSASSLSSWSIVDEDLITPTPTTTVQPTSTPTLTPTPDIWVYWTLPAEISEEEQGVMVEYRFTGGGMLIAIVMFGQFVLLFVIAVQQQKNRRRNGTNKNDL